MKTVKTMTTFTTMKTFGTMTRSIRTVGAAIVCAAALAACSSDDNVIDEQPMKPTEPQVYTMTVQATKTTGDDAANSRTTRALALDGKTLNATWKTGETVDVYKVTTVGSEETYTSVGTLTAQADGATATLSGNLTGTFAVSDQLVLFFNGGELDYQGQTGTLDGIASNYDYATASGEVTAIDGDNITVVDATTSSATIPFDNQQAIVKFTLKDKATGNPISMKSLKLHDAGKNIFRITDYLHGGAGTKGDITVTRAEAGSEFFVAIKTETEWIEEPVGSGYKDVPLSLDLTLTATGDVPADPSVAIDRYTYTKSGVKFYPGKYYEVTVSMTKLTENVVNMYDVGDVWANPGNSYTARTGDVLTGEAQDIDDSENGIETVKRITINIADGATVTLRNVTIDGSSYSGSSTDMHAGITCEGDATIILEGTNTVKGFYSTYPGIYVPEGKTLTIRGDGSLNASSSGGAAGIGGGNNLACGNIVIEGGTITAAGYGSAAGIGSGNASSCGDISITGGTVTATGGPLSAGIGGGCYGSCGTITIAKTITSVTATKGNNTSTSNNTDPYSIGVGSDNLDYHDNNVCACGTITFDNVTFAPTWTAGTDSDHPNTWTYSPEPASGTYGGLTLAISGNTWTLTPVTP